MEFNKLASAIFEGVPEFKKFYKGELDKDSPYLFLSPFGSFVHNSVVDKKSYSASAISFINSFINDNIEDEELKTQMTVGVLEMLTDTAICQKEASKYFTNHCYKMFDNLLKTYFIDLRNT
ncbi:hypothetical protein ACVW0P_003576 [Mucilaginibacter sp. UYNi724]